MNTYLKGEFDMCRIFKIIICMVLALLLTSCSNSKSEIISVSSEELLQDASNPGYFRKKYRNNEIYITGEVLDIGVPKHNPSKRDTTYITIAEDEKTFVLVYFDFFVNHYLTENQKIKIKCKFKSFRTPSISYDGNVVRFIKGEIVEIYP